MSKQSTSTAPAVPAFEPVALRTRKDGWTPQKQVAFIQALMATCCVEEAAQHVGMTARSARDLRTRRDAQSFRMAWQAALAAGVPRIVEAAMQRAIHGVATPVFFKGEKIGERVHFNERLTTFLLRYHAPQRYGAWRDKAIVEQRHTDGDAMLFEESVRRLVADCVADAFGRPRETHPPLVSEANADDPDFDDAGVAAKEKLYEMRDKAEWDAFERKLAADRARWEAEARAGSSAPDGSSDALHEGSAASAGD